LQNANILQACLHLVSELDVDSLEIVADAIHSKMESLWIVDCSLIQF